jgi:hypothetical protein
MRTKYIFLIRFLILFSTLISILFSLFNKTSFDNVYILPLVFILLYPIYDNFIFKRKKKEISLFVIFITYWIRLVLLPIISYTFQEKLNVDYSFPIFLSVYEFFVVTFFFMIYYISSSSVLWKKKIELYGEKNIYLLFAALALFIYVFYARNMGLFEFAFKALGTEERSGDVVDFRLLMIRQIIDSGMLFALLVVLSKLNKSFNLKLKKRYIYFSLFISLLFVSVIIGERRSSIIYKTFSVGFLLITMFPYHKSMIYKYLGSVLFIIMLFMTLYKSFNAFRYNSYYEAILESESKTLDESVYDSYFYGLRTIKRNIDFADVGIVKIDNLAFDFVRSIFGVHFLFKSGHTTTEIFNLRRHQGEQSSGALYSSIGYGYTYFGAILSPLIIILNIIVMLFIEKKMKKSSSIEYKYIYAFIFARYAFGFSGDPAQLINLVSRFLIISGIIYSISRFPKLIRKI